MSKQLGLLEDALATFLGLDEALPDTADVMYQAGCKSLSKLPMCGIQMPGLSSGFHALVWLDKRPAPAYLFRRPLKLTRGGAGRGRVLEMRGEAQQCLAWAGAPERSGPHGCGRADPHGCPACAAGDGLPSPETGYASPCCASPNSAADCALGLAILVHWVVLAAGLAGRAAPRIKSALLL